jgi:hypothetical protein
MPQGQPDNVEKSANNLKKIVGSVNKILGK